MQPMMQGCYPPFLLPISYNPHLVHPEHPRPMTNFFNIFAINVQLLTRDPDSKEIEHIYMKY